MQGLSEGVEVERRLAGWWKTIQVFISTYDMPPAQIIDLLSSGLESQKALDAAVGDTKSERIPAAICRYLAALAAPPRIHAIRYEFLLKGYRREDKELTQRLGVTVYSQQSHLVRQYVATSVPKKGDGGYSVGDVCWSWDFYRPEDDKNSKLAWQNWASRPLAETTQWPVKEWIDKLDASELVMSGEDSTVGLEPRVLGWKSPAQAVGVTKTHPLDEVFVPPVVVYRNLDDLRDWVDATEAQERRNAEAVAEINATTDEGERRHLLNVHFPMVRTACEYPGQCVYARDRVGVCYAGAEMKADPLRVGAGEYRVRTPNHPVETQSLVPIK
jgi:hypothetical protein